MSKEISCQSLPKIKVIGIGKAGCQAINHMIHQPMPGLEFIVMDCDLVELAVSEAPVRIALGEKLTHGRGAGGDHNVGRRLAEENRDKIKQVLNGSDIVFLVAGMGGGTGTGAIGVIADIAKQSGALTIAAVTEPFSFEGCRRRRVGGEGTIELVPSVDTTMIIHDDGLLALCDGKTTTDGAFKMAIESLCPPVRSIAEMFTMPNLVDLDLASLTVMMKNAGPAWTAIGRGSGRTRTIDATRDALKSPMLDVSITVAKGVLCNLTSGQTLTLSEVNQSAEVISQVLGSKTKIIFGGSIDPNMGKEVKLTLVAMGFTRRVWLNRIRSYYSDAVKL